MHIGRHSVGSFLQTREKYLLYLQMDKLNISGSKKALLQNVQVILLHIDTEKEGQK